MAVDEPSNLYVQDAFAYYKACELVSTNFDKAVDWADQIHNPKLKDKAKCEVVSYAARNFDADEVKMRRMLDILASISSDQVRSKCADRLLKHVKINGGQNKIQPFLPIIEAEKISP